MGLFGPKKKEKDSFRTLTEREIQARLYGHLREPGSVEEDRPSLSKPKPPQDTSVLHKTTTASTSKTFASSAGPVIHKPSISAPELFEDPESELEGETAKNFLEAPPPVKTREPSSSKSGLTVRSGIREKPRPSLPVVAFRKNTARTLQGMGNILRTAGLKILAFLGWTIAVIFRFATALRFKKTAVRRLVYAGLGLGVLALTFFGIHLLNVQREAAMKSPAKIVDPVVAKAPPAESPKEKKESAKTAPIQRKAVESLPTLAVTTQKKTPPLRPQRIEGPAYVVQAATFAAREDARKLSERFKADTLKAFIKPLSRSGGRVYYCVFLGPFKTQQEADATLASFKKKEIAQPFQDAFVRLLQ